jgi:heat shock protein HslJ
MRSVAIVVSAVIALAACSGDGGSGTPTDPDRLAGLTWQLDGPSAEALTGTPPAAAVTIRFEDGDVGGTSACNTYAGTYEAGDDGSLSFGDLGGTEMACVPSVMSLETAYLEALRGVTRFTVDAGVLRLTGTGAVLSFTKQLPVEPLPLVGTEWALGSVYSGETVASAVEESAVSMTLREDGTVAGTTGCNRYHGAYTTDGDALRLSAIASTKRACGEAIMDQERVFLGALDAVRGFTIEGDQLTLLDEGGSPVLGFVGSRG